MFGVGFTEIIAIIVVGVIILRPEDWPKTVYNIGKLYGKARRVYHLMANDIQSIVEKELNKPSSKPEEDSYNENDNPV